MPRHAKLTAEQARAIREDERPARVVALEHGVCRQTVYEIRRGMTWKTVDGPRRHRPRITTAAVLSIRADDRAAAIVAAEHGVTKGVVWRIWRGGAYAWVA